MPHHQQQNTATALTAFKRLMRRMGVAFLRLSDVPAFVRWLNQYLPLRHRHVLTRGNRLRLRYAAPLAVCLVGLLSVVLAGAATVTSTAYSAMSSYSYAAVLNGIMPAGGGVTPVDVARRNPDAVRQRYEMTQKRLHRYGGESGGVNFAAAVPMIVPGPRQQTVEVGKGDTLGGVLQKAGLSGADAYQVVKALEAHYDPRQLKPGQKLELRFDPQGAGGKDYQFSSLKMAVDSLKTVSLKRKAGDEGEAAYQTALEEKPVVTRTAAGRAAIEVSLYGSALKAGLPHSVVTDAIRVFSWDIDFQRDIRKGDAIELLYETVETEDGELIKTGEVLYARLSVNGQDIPVYRFETPDGNVDYYTPDGKSIRKTLMKTPIDGARISSGFGMRRHPVMGYSKMHKGVDFAAPTGTPIYAAGDGTIDRLGRWSSYGNYVSIRHNSSLKTAYAHMSRFAKGLSAGSRVKQGQIIGYVGTTGRSTGPHLHYEILMNGAHVNPSGIKMAQGETLKGPQLDAFKTHMRRLDGDYASLTKGVKLVSRADVAATKQVR